VQSQVPEKDIILWEGFCPTHIRLREEDVVAAKKIHPYAEFLAHPECNPEVLDMADSICSTGGMLKYVKKASKKKFIIGTECGMLYGLKKENPDKLFLMPTSHLICANMKLTTLGWVLHSLEKEVYEVKVPKEIADKARKSLKRMLELSSKEK